MWRRRVKQQPTAQMEGTSTTDEQPRVAPAVTLRPMTADDYQHLRAYMDEGYAQEVAQVMDMTIEEGRAAAAKQLAELLKDGHATEGHYLWKVIADDDGAVGDLWAFVDPAKHRAFIYFIGIDSQFRGKGYGKATMLALEVAVKPLGADHINLSVFGANTTAINLYQSLGYQPVAINMRKEL